MADVLIRAPRVGDSESLARVWLDNVACDASLNPGLDQVPEVNGLAR